MTEDKNDKKNKPDQQSDNLLNYINQEMNDVHQHEFEKEMMEDPFLNDAVEGLSTVQSKEELNKIVQELNRDLKKKLDQRKSEKEKKRYKNPPFLISTILFVLLLLIITVIVILKLQG